MFERFAPELEAFEFRKGIDGSYALEHQVFEGLQGDG